MSTALSLMTTEEFLALPEDGKDRALIDGQLRIYGEGNGEMTVRNRWHAQVVAKFAYHLLCWVEACAIRPGEVFSGEVGCILKRDPDTTVGIDVAYFSAKTLELQSSATTLIEGVPELAVEVLSPSDTHEDVSEKVEKYLSAQTSLVWVVDPDFRTITVYRPDAAPELFNVHQEIAADPHLPGFKVAVAKFFA
jgi:Uma2 family endonuclease